MSPKQPGTFADLYEVEQTLRATKSGRPRRKQPRKQVTLHLTQEQEEALSDMHHTLHKQFSIDRSDLAGFAIELLAGLVTEHNEISNFQNFESLKFNILKRIQD